MEDFVPRFPFGIELDIDHRRADHTKLLELLNPVQPVYQERSQYLGKGNERWVVKPSPRSGVKICSPILPPDEESHQHLLAVLNLLEFTGLSEEWNTPITRRCAYHLHLDISDLTLNEITWAITAARLIEPAIMGVLPRSRHKAADAQMLHQHLDSTLLGQPQLLEAVSSEILAVNLKTLLIRGDLHIKYAPGTTNFGKILNWVILWSSVVDRVLLHGPPSRELKNMEEVSNWLLWPEDPEQETQLGAVRHFWLYREAHFQEQRRERVRRKYGATDEDEGADQEGDEG